MTDSSRTKEHPILFSTPMVQAILEGRKTMTRRIVKPQPDDDGLWDDTNLPRSLQSTLKGWNGSTEETGESREWRCPYGQVGDILWVRETWTEYKKYIYKADYIDNGVQAQAIKWTPSIFMPKEACRIFLEIIGIRVERLKDISNGDAKSEGIKYVIDKITGFCGFDHINGGYNLMTTPYHGFRSLWQSINGKESWEANLWVWVIEFKQTTKQGI